jgi:very-short-patch-repair endonuclease
MNRIRSQARALRKNPTEVERLLWRHLRFWQLDCYKFRRQQPLGNYIVDFVCLEKRLVIELDGGQHTEQTNYDSTRDAWLRAEGFLVLRFWNNDVTQNIDGVKDLILKALESTPYLNPSPQGGRRKMKRRKVPERVRL